MVNEHTTTTMRLGAGDTADIRVEQDSEVDNAIKQAELLGAARMRAAWLDALIAKADRCLEQGLVGTSAIIRGVAIEIAEKLTPESVCQGGGSITRTTDGPPPNLET